MKDAAKDWGYTYNGSSIQNNRELGSRIYIVTKDGGKYFTYTAPYPGTGGTTNTSIEPRGVKVVADIHSHAAWDKKYVGKGDDGKEIDWNDKFSNQDKNDNYRKKIDGYLASPDGSLQKYDVKTTKESVIATDLPSDKNDPGRKNKIDPKIDPPKVESKKPEEIRGFGKNSVSINPDP